MMQNSTDRPTYMKIHDKQVDGRAVAAFKELLKAAPEKDILRFVSIT